VVVGLTVVFPTFFGQLEPGYGIASVHRNKTSCLLSNTGCRSGASSPSHRDTGAPKLKRWDFTCVAPSSRHDKMLETRRPCTDLQRQRTIGMLGPDFSRPSSLSSIHVSFYYSLRTALPFHIPPPLLRNLDASALDYLSGERFACHFGTTWAPTSLSQIARVLHTCNMHAV